MRSALCEAVARCQLRRLRGAAAAAPVPAAVLALALALAPFALSHLGHSLGRELAGADGTGAISGAIVLGPLLAAAVAGAGLAVSFPGRAALGHQLAGGPVGQVSAVVATVLVPATGGVVVLLPSLLAVSVGLAAELPGGRVAGAALAAAVTSAVPAGAVVAEMVLATIRRHLWKPVAILAGALGWAGGGMVLGAAPLGPLALVRDALRGSVPAWAALGVSGAVAVILALAWVVLAATRPASRPRGYRSRPARRPVRGGRMPIPLAVGALLARRGDIRLTACGAVGFGLAGIAIAGSAGAPPPTPFLLGATTALFGSILCPLLVGGVLVEGRWLWRGGPVERRVVVRAAGFAGIAGAVAPVVAVGVVAAAASGAAWSTVGVVGALVVTGSGLALLAGALIPCCGRGAGDQMTTFAALAAMAVAASLTVGLAAPGIVALGVPDSAVVVFVCAISVGGGLVALGRRLGADGS